MIQHRTLVKSFGHAIAGLIHALRHNQNLRIHFFAATIVSVLAVLLQINPFEKGILGLTILLVISAEMINTSIEEMVDLITTEHRQQAKIAKDVAAGMVLVTSIGAVVVGILIFSPYIIRAAGFA
jgi:diacylglycerol kinase